MRDYEFLDVVIASSWREDMALEELREHFSADLRHRVIGVTPVHDVDPFSEIHGSRLGEVLAYLRASWCPAWLLDSFG